ncbi:MAG: hypothetical protein LBP67_06790 [Bacteroidales bacterium]|jgi:aspartate kinase|nr:hypothetical protein [Bacteroidales bacterium]
MIVHKFGGASVKDAESIRRVPSLLKSIDDERVFIVISAMGKTTNKLEIITNRAFEREDFIDLFEELKNEHLALIYDLLPEDKDSYKLLFELFVECLNVIVTTSKDYYSFFYDQVVSFGERFSSFILESYLKHCGFDVKLLDAEKLFTSDDNWRAGNVDTVLSKRSIEDAISLNNNKFLITQGFIAGAYSGESVTLGREGSDYSAGLIAAYSNASEIIFWKDVDGIYSADPKMQLYATTRGNGEKVIMSNFSSELEKSEAVIQNLKPIFGPAVKINKMSYSEMIELSFFGAKVLHEKTLFALQDKNIKMQVRSFINVDRQGTYLFNTSEEKYPPIKILSENQILYTCEPRSRALINSNHIKLIYDCADDCNVNIGLIQMSALKISFCAAYDEFACSKMYSRLKDNFKVKYNSNVLLVTLRHYSDENLAEFADAENVLLSQISRVTAQFVLKSYR